MNHEEQPHEPPDQPQPPEGDPADPERTPAAGPQIWVGSLSDYNNGVLHGTWINAARVPDEIRADIQAMLDASPGAAAYGQPAEEWGIFDFESFGSYRLHEHEDLEVVSRIARGIAEHGLAYAAYAEVMDGDPETLANFAEDYLGHYDSVQAYAERLVADLDYLRLLHESLPPSLEQYISIDTEALARDLQLGGDIHVLPANEGGVWIFRGEQ
jgi:antirestriction protein